MTNYLKLEGPSGLFVVETVFVSNLVSWIYFRLYVFPLKVIWRGTLGAGHDPDTGARTFGYTVDAPLDPGNPHHAMALYGKEYGFESSEFAWHRFRIKHGGCGLLWPVRFSSPRTNGLHQ